MEFMRYASIYSASFVWGFNLVLAMTLQMYIL